MREREGGRHERKQARQSSDGGEVKGEWERPASERNDDVMVMVMMKRRRGGGGKTDDDGVIISQGGALWHG